MENLRSYLSREGWQRDKYKTREDLDKIISTIKPKTHLGNQRGDVGSEVAAVVALTSGLGLLLLGAGGHVYGFIQNCPQNINDAYQFYKLGGLGATIGALGFLTSNWFD